MRAAAQFNHDKARYEYWIDSAPDKVIRRRREIQYLAGGGSKGRPGAAPPERSAITEYKPAAASRLRRYIDNYYRDFVGMLTLTYGEEYPNDGQVVKKHLRAFFERLRRSGYFNNESLVWWLEFQDRGAPHVHAVLTGWLSRKFVAKAWAGITNGDESACTRVESLRDADGVGSYAAKYASKSDQKEVPAGFINVGRFWGCRGGAKGVPKCPKVVAAATPGPTRELLRSWARARASAYAHGGASATGARAGVVLNGRLLPSIRVYEHEGGFSVYGREKEIQAIWQSQERLLVITSLEDQSQGDSARKTWRGSIATR